MTRLLVPRFAEVFANLQAAKYAFEMKHAGTRPDSAWRKSRLAARLLLRKEAGRMPPRDEILARRLSQDPEVSNRLIQQALYFLGIGPRKNAFDQKLVDGRN